jgi:hypothetical protein
MTIFLSRDGFDQKSVAQQTGLVAHELFGLIGLDNDYSLSEALAEFFLKQDIGRSGKPEQPAGAEGRNIIGDWNGFIVSLETSLFGMEKNLSWPEFRDAKFPGDTFRLSLFARLYMDFHVEKKADGLRVSGTLFSPEISDTDVPPEKARMLVNNREQQVFSNLLVQKRGDKYFFSFRAPIAKLRSVFSPRVELRAESFLTECLFSPSEQTLKLTLKLCQDESNDSCADYDFSNLDRTVVIRSLSYKLQRTP